MAVGENFIFIGCAEGIVRCFSPATLQFVTTLPRTHYLGVDVAQGLSIRSVTADSRYLFSCYLSFTLRRFNFDWKFVRLPLHLAILPQEQIFACLFLNK
jgi:hypothetical protein